MKSTVTQWAQAEGISKVAAYARLKKLGIRATDGLIDTDAVNARWERERDARQAARNPSGVAKAAPAAKHADPQVAEPKSKATLGDAQLAKELLAIEEKQLKLKQLKGRLVSREEVEATAFEQARRERDALLAWPARVSPIIAGELDADERKLFALLDQHIREFLEERI